jgi:hypothetical protein
MINFSLQLIDFKIQQVILFFLSLKLILKFLVHLDDFILLFNDFETSNAARVDLSLIFWRQAKDE